MNIDVDALNETKSVKKEMGGTNIEESGSGYTVFGKGNEPIIHGVDLVVKTKPSTYPQHSQWETHHLSFSI